MKIKTSITLSPTTLSALDEAMGDSSNRSRIIEIAVLDYLARLRVAARDARDLDLLNRHADALNGEMEDVLAFQAEI